ncbi:alpha/beta hydrolase [Streptomyces sp. NPDC005811]|uniref:alpha/beta fold hydrolase n=1 Tax=Streptomyces sp. NPDC005811 TaxID=3154565 RepID=UPI0033CB7F8F
MISRRGLGGWAGAGAVGAALTGPGAPAATAADTGTGTRVRPSGDAPFFGPLRQVRAGVLDIGYVERGPAHGPAVVLLHGWPYDIHSYAEVAPLLAARGHRVVVPYLRGHGTTRFRSARTARNAQQSAVALDVLALMDALGIERAVLAGFDWGSRTADVVAALWPGRCTALVSVTGYLITDREANRAPLPPSAEWAWWYQYYFATERGRLGLENPAYRTDLARQVWRFNSPTWDFDEAAFARTATAFDNPDHVDIVIHNYRWRLGLAEGEARYDDLERRLARRPVIGVPTVTLDGERDPFTPAGDGAMYRDRFSGPYAHRTLAGVGHNVPQEAPEAFTDAVLEARALAG